MQKVSNVINKVDNTLLKRSLMEACSDEKFKSYLSSLELDENVLMKYTSNLKDSFKEVKNCDYCKSLTNCPNKMKGYYYCAEKGNNKLSFSYVACSKYNNYLQKNAYTKNTNFFELPIELREASFKNIYKDDKARLPIVKYFKEFIEQYQKEKQGKGLYLFGSFGSGKTYLISALFNEMAKKGVKSASVYYPELLRNLKSSFSSDYEERFRYIKKVPLLLLDDIGAENVTAWGRDEVLGPILQYRMEEKLPTFFTSNLTLEELENNFILHKTSVERIKARRIIERMRQLTKTIELVSESRRNF